MLIVFVWLGSILPDRYLNVIRHCQSYENNRCVLLQEVHQKIYLAKYKDLLNVTDLRIKSMIMVERADVLRLLYLYDKGGIYSDLDNTIDYACLQKLTAKYNETFYFGEEQWEPKNASNNFIYSPQPGHPELKRVIQKIHQCPDCVGLKFASPYFLNRIKVPYKIMKSCLKHGYESTWWWWKHKNLKSPEQARKQALQKQQQEKKKDANLTPQQKQQKKKQKQALAAQCNKQSQVLKDKCSFERSVFSQGKQQYQKNLKDCEAKLVVTQNQLKTVTSVKDKSAALLECQKKLEINREKAKTLSKCEAKPKDLSECQLQLQKVNNQIKELNKQLSEGDKAKGVDSSCQDNTKLLISLVVSSFLLMIILLYQVLNRFCSKKQVKSSKPVRNIQSERQAPMQSENRMEISEITEEN